MEAQEILIADDDEFMLEAICQYLEQGNYTLIRAEDGLEAYQICQERTPDLILLDAKMPRMDGFEACIKLKENQKNSDIPIIMVTALDDDDSIDRAFAAGAEEYITKPINWSVLRHRVRLTLQSKETEKRLRQEIAERKKLAEKLRRQAELDFLTGLPNRALFHDRLNQVLLMNERASCEAIVLMFIDLDRFKWVNDTLGHEAGDLLLIEVANRLQSCVRKTDTVARLGGDEFTIIFPHIQPTSFSEQIAKKILRQLTQPFILNQQVVQISGSIGITISPQDGSHPDTLIKNADTAMYQAKQSGKNAYQFFATTPT
ncbi:diguanylate cyclase domain-containing protein [Magnetococcales bacterium HHB-1]